MLADGRWGEKEAVQAICSLKYQSGHWRPHPDAPGNPELRSSARNLLVVVCQCPVLHGTRGGAAATRTQYWVNVDTRGEQSERSESLRIVGAEGEVDGAQAALLQGMELDDAALMAGFPSVLCAARGGAAAGMPMPLPHAPVPAEGAGKGAGRGGKGGKGGKGGEGDEGAEAKRPKRARPDIMSGVMQPETANAWKAEWITQLLRDIGACSTSVEQLKGLT